MVVGAVGVVFGDIGTSPIYTIQTAFNLNDPHPVPISTDNVFGVVSLVFWSVMIVVTLTYITLVMRADTTAGAASWRSSRCGGTAGRGVVAPP
jgi:KUP system potassium uptake protein